MSELRVSPTPDGGGGALNAEITEWEVLVNGSKVSGPPYKVKYGSRVSFRVYVRVYTKGTYRVSLKVGKEETKSDWGTLEPALYYVEFSWIESRPNGSYDIVTELYGKVGTEEKLIDHHEAEGAWRVYGAPEGVGKVKVPEELKTLGVVAGASATSALVSAIVAGAKNRLPAAVAGAVAGGITSYLFKEAFMKKK